MTDNNSHLNLPVRIHISAEHPYQWTNEGPKPWSNTLVDISEHYTDMNFFADRAKAMRTSFGDLMKKK